MQKLLIYHNPRCSKSREACSLAEQKKMQVEVINYLEQPPTEKQLKELLKKLKMKAADIVRKKEPLFKEKFENKNITEAGWIKILVKHPILLERPIVVKGNKAVVARPAERINELLK